MQPFLFRNDSKLFYVRWIGYRCYNKISEKFLTKEMGDDYEF